MLAMAVLTVALLVGGVIAGADIPFGNKGHIPFIFRSIATSHGRFSDFHPG
jgi:hypothetical protein